MSSRWNTSGAWDRIGPRSLLRSRSSRPQYRVADLGRLSESSASRARYIHYEHHGPGKTSSKTVATKIVQIDEAGTANEREKPEGRDSGYLWRWNSYWRFEQEDNGVVVECETVSLSRSVSKAFWWFVKPFVSSVPKQALQSTLESLRDGVQATRP